MEREGDPRNSLRFLPLHARSVALVLTGYVSPQFHVVFDPMFATVSGIDGSPTPPSLWQGKCGFTSAPASQYAHVHKNEAPPDVIDPGMPTEKGVQSTDVAPNSHEETAPREIQVEVNNDPSKSPTRTIHESQQEDQPSGIAIDDKQKQP
jgi:hypothetical protein